MGFLFAGVAMLNWDGDQDLDVPSFNKPYRRQQRVDVYNGWKLLHPVTSINYKIINLLVAYTRNLTHLSGLSDTHIRARMHFPVVASIKQSIRFAAPTPLVLIPHRLLFFHRPTRIPPTPCRRSAACRYDHSLSTREAGHHSFTITLHIPRSDIHHASKPHNEHPSIPHCPSLRITYPPSFPPSIPFASCQNFRNLPGSINHAPF